MTHSKTHTKIRTVMYLSKKKLMKKLTPLKMKKNASNSSKKSTNETEELQEKHKMPCWIEMHKRTKWRMARENYDKRWNKRVFDWHPGLDTSIKTGRQIGRSKRRWENDLNDFLKMEGSHERTKNDFMNNDSWMSEAKKYKDWKDKEESFTKIW